MACLKQRGEMFYLQWYEGGRQRRRSLETESFQVAKERLRQFESAQHRGEALPLPTRTPIGEVVEAFVAHMRAHRPERSWRRDVSYLRESFGEVCPALELTFVYSAWNGEPACFLTEEEIVEELGRAGFERDGAGPMKEYNVPRAGELPRAGPPVIYEGTFVRE